MYGIGCITVILCIIDILDCGQIESNLSCNLEQMNQCSNHNYIQKQDYTYENFQVYTELHPLKNVI